MQSRDLGKRREHSYGISLMQMRLMSDSLDVILQLDVCSLPTALQHLMQQLLGNMSTLLPAGLLLQRSAQSVMRCFR